MAPAMQIVDDKVIRDRTGNIVTLVIAHKNGKLYFAVAKALLSSYALRHSNPSTWAGPLTLVPPQVVNLANFYPGYQSTYTRYTPKQGDGTEDVWVKHQDILTLVSEIGIRIVNETYTGDITAREISACEDFRRSPHVNVAEYCGVQASTAFRYTYGGLRTSVPLDKERVRSLVFRRYDCSLYELITRKQLSDIRYCLESIASGIKHIHRVGYVHSDIKPHNIFVKVGSGRRQHFVVGDFDSVHPTGAPITLKGGDKQWTRHKGPTSYAEEEDDWYAFRILKKWVVDYVGGRLELYDGIGKPTPVQQVENPIYRAGVSITYKPKQKTKVVLHVRAKGKK